MGVELFPVIIKSIESPDYSKKPIAVIFLNNPQQAEISANQLRKFLPNPIKVVSISQFLQTEIFSAAFITHPKLHNDRLIQHTSRLKILTFSPFYQAINYKVDTGLIVKEQVRPQINLQQTSSKRIVFKPFFLRVAEIHE